ncbi:hypothetical protein BJ875DRAFT_444550 [Amylocarpus encephaloides]|uniref:Uncharacterized protein n=1 Tax=Amylocarpus encephaloides TaxID=45428 RepID=A0A9P7YCZ6_9HELO|nr:hypothetical protein BJ875DRAFT_444550 [Amylocarpus encephaloides]
MVPSIIVISPEQKIAQQPSQPAISHSQSPFATTDQSSRHRRQSPALPQKDVTGKKEVTSRVPSPPSPHRAPAPGRHEGVSQSTMAQGSCGSRNVPHHIDTSPREASTANEFSATTQNPKKCRAFCLASPPRSRLGSDGRRQLLPLLVGLRGPGDAVAHGCCVLMLCYRAWQLIRQSSTLAMDIIRSRPDRQSSTLAMDIVQYGQGPTGSRSCIRDLEHFPLRRSGRSAGRSARKQVGRLPGWL